VLSDGRKVTVELFHAIANEELKKIENTVRTERFRAGKYRDAADLFTKLTTNDQFISFLTLPGYERLG
jgi:malate synthase